MKTKQCVVFDLDGTLALVDHRRHLVAGKKKDFQAFDKACVNDVPNRPVIEIFKLFQSSGLYRMVILSGRSEVVRAETESWLQEKGITFDLLMMRPKDDFSPDEQLKKSWFDEKLDRDQILCIFDDRKKVVEMWRGAGLSCFQVADGNF